MLALNKNSLAIPDELGEQPSAQQEVVITKFQRLLKQHSLAFSKIVILLRTFHGRQYLANQISQDTL